MDNFSTSDLVIWRQEALRRLQRSIIISVVVGLITFCGGALFGIYINQKTLHLSNYITFLSPGVLIILAAIGQKKWNWHPAINGYILWCSFFTATAFNAATTTIDPTIAILVNVPVFLTPALILFWHPRHTIIVFVFAGFINTLLAWWLSAHPLNIYVLRWLLVVPIGLGAIALSWFKYYPARRTFLASLMLSRMNEELQRSNEVIQENQAELEAQNHQLEDSKRQIELRNEQITDSIRYAQRIQRAVLSNANHILSRFDDNFILFRPKEMLSGDFYWGTYLNENQTIWIAADCTGHGVPGALLTIIGSGLLDEIVKQKQITNPCDIVANLNNRMSEIITAGDDNKLRDGIDLAVVLIDQQQQTVTLSGATAAVGVVSERGWELYRNPKFSVGGNNRFENRKKFENQVINYQKGDVLYAFSDGFQDQFGGDKKRKFLSRRFYDLLASISHLDMKQQKQSLEQELTVWKGSLQQTDDVMVIGVRL